MKNFPKPIYNLPKADIKLDGIKAYLSQGENHQIVFMEFEKDVDLPPHAHDSQWEIVLDGKVDLSIEDQKRTYSRGENFYIEKGVEHSAKIYSGYASIVFFNEKGRYAKRKI